MKHQGVVIRIEQIVFEAFTRRFKEFEILKERGGGCRGWKGEVD